MEDGSSAGEDDVKRFNAQNATRSIRELVALVNEGIDIEQTAVLMNELIEAKETAAREYLTKFGGIVPVQAALLRKLMGAQKEGNLRALVDEYAAATKDWRNEKLLWNAVTYNAFDILEMRTRQFAGDYFSLVNALTHFYLQDHKE